MVFFLLLMSIFVVHFFFDVFIYLFYLAEDAFSELLILFLLNFIMVIKTPSLSSMTPCITAEASSSAAPHLSLPLLLMALLHMLLLPWPLLFLSILSLPVLLLLPMSPVIEML